VGADCYGRCAGVVAGHVESLRTCEWGYFVGACVVGVGGFADDPRGRKLMSATYSACLACGIEFYGFGYAGEPCSEKCSLVLLEMKKGKTNDHT
jgi:hypothetical protein